MTKSYGNDPLAVFGACLVIVGALYALTMPGVNGSDPFVNGGVVVCVGAILMIRAWFARRGK